MRKYKTTEKERKDGLVRYYRNKEKRLKQMKEYDQSHRAERAVINRQWRETIEGKLSVKKSVKKYELVNLERRKAWVKARVLPSKPCEICSVENSHKHHPDIKKPLEVIYLCPLHHKHEHMLK